MVFIIFCYSQKRRDLFSLFLLTRQFIFHLSTAYLETMENIIITIALHRQNVDIRYEIKTICNPDADNQSPFHKI